MVRQLTKKDAYSAFEYALKAPETEAMAKTIRCFSNIFTIRWS
jgi:hypothetical protein